MTVFLHDDDLDTAPSTVLLPMVATSHRLGLTAVKILTDAQGNGPADGPV